MAHPATVDEGSEPFAARELDFTGSVPGRVVLHSPAARALAELSLALNADFADNAPREVAWSRGQTLRFILLSCGIFWAVIGGTIFAFR